MATVIVSPEAQPGIDALPVGIRARVDELLARLEKWPAVSGVKRLSAGLAGLCRLRTGDYRVLFRVEETRRTIREEKVVKEKVKVAERVEVDYRVVVERVGHRKDIYEG